MAADSMGFQIDEAALDAESERPVQDALSSVMAG